MNRALLELLALNVRGRLVRWVRLLRQPKYLLAFLATVGYFVWVFGFRFLGSAFRRNPIATVPEDFAAAAELGIGLVVALVMTGVWIFTSSRPALKLSESEVHLLLPAPLTRRQVVQFGILKEQPGILLGAAFFTLFRGTGSPGSRLLGFFVAWALLALIDLHVKGVSLWKARLREMPPAGARLRWAVAVVLATAWWAAVLWAVVQAWQSVFPEGLLSIDDPPAAIRELTLALHAGALDELLAPFVWLSAPLLGGIPVRRAAGLLVLLLAIAAHVEWAVRSRVRFEEATLERARRDLARKDRRARRESISARWRTREPFRLAPAGAPEAAILWKNLMLRGRMPLKTMAGLAAGGFLVLTGVGAAFGGAATGVMATAGISLLCGMPLLAGLTLRNDLRVDLLHLDVLRTWPIPGRRLVLAEMLAPMVGVLVMQLFGCCLLLAAVAGDFLGGRREIRVLPDRLFAGLPPGIGLLLALASAVILGVAAALLSIAIQNLAALLLPGWVGLGLERKRGTSMIGQNLLLGLGHLLALAIAALPSLLALGAVWAVLHLLLDLRFTFWELPVLAVVAALPLLLVTGLLVRFAGEAWERLDPSQEILEPVE